MTPKEKKSARVAHETGLRRRYAIIGADMVANLAHLGIETDSEAYRGVILEKPSTAHPYHSALVPCWVRVRATPEIETMTEQGPES